MKGSVADDYVRMMLKQKKKRCQSLVLSENTVTQEETGAELQFRACFLLCEKVVVAILRQPVRCAQALYYLVRPMNNVSWCNRLLERSRYNEDCPGLAQPSGEDDGCAL